jgi:hypothetical protein
MIEISRYELLVMQQRSLEEGMLNLKLDSRMPAPFDVPIANEQESEGYH